MKGLKRSRSECSVENNDSNNSSNASDFLRRRSKSSLQEQNNSNGSSQPSSSRSNLFGDSLAPATTFVSDSAFTKTQQKGSLFGRVLESSLKTPQKSSTTHVLDWIESTFAAASPAASEKEGSRWRHASIHDLPELSICSQIQVDGPHLPHRLRLPAVYVADGRRSTLYAAVQAWLQQSSHYLYMVDEQSEPILCFSKNNGKLTATLEHPTSYWRQLLAQSKDIPYQPPAPSKASSLLSPSTKADLDALRKGHTVGVSVSVAVHSSQQQPQREAITLQGWDPVLALVEVLLNTTDLPAYSILAPFAFENGICRHARTRQTFAAGNSCWTMDRLLPHQLAALLATLVQQSRQHFVLRTADGNLEMVAWDAATPHTVAYTMRNE